MIYLSCVIKFHSVCIPSMVLSRLMSSSDGARCFHGDHTSSQDNFFCTHYLPGCLPSRPLPRSSSWAVPGCWAFSRLTGWQAPWCTCSPLSTACRGPSSSSFIVCSTTRYGAAYFHLPLCIEPSTSYVWSRPTFLSRILCCVCMCVVCICVYVYVIVCCTCVFVHVLLFTRRLETDIWCLSPSFPPHL